MENIGSVFYAKGIEPGTLHAKWCHSEKGTGTGIATGGPKEGYAGLYEIKYFDRNGNLSAVRGLEIKQNGDTYDVYWLTEGVVTSNGIGIDVGEGLSVGWFRLNK